MTDAAPTPDLSRAAQILEERCGDSAILLGLAAGLRAAATALRPATVIAMALQLPVNQRSPAKIARGEAFARMAACQRYSGKTGKPLYAAMLLDLQRYALSAAWRADRLKEACPYLASDWHSGAWRALKVDGAVPSHWKTLKRAVSGVDKLSLSTANAQVLRNHTPAESQNDATNS